MKNGLQKNFMSFCMMFVLVLAFGNIDSASATSNDEKAIKDVVTKYLSWELESTNELSNEEILKLDNLVKNDILKDFKVADASILHEIYKQSNDGIKEYQVHIEFTSIDIKDDKAIVNVNSGDDFRSKSDSDVLQQNLPIPHKIELIKEGTNWKIINDFFKQESFAYDFNEENMKSENSNPMETRTLELKESLKNVDEVIVNSQQRVAKTEAHDEISSHRTKRSLKARGEYPHYYDKNAAVNYAIKWAKGRNPDFNNYDDKVWGAGGDCTNFVSQALAAGHVRADETWYKHSKAWRSVVLFRHWLVNKGYATEYEGKGWYASKGNIIQFNKTGKQWSHSAMITASNDQTGKMYLSARSSDALNVDVRIYEATYPKVRYLRIKP
jgi:hypothetical protein